MGRPLPEWMALPCLTSLALIAAVACESGSELAQWQIRIADGTVDGVERLDVLDGTLSPSLAARRAHGEIGGCGKVAPSAGWSLNSPAGS